MKILTRIFDLLDNPSIYNLVQRLFAANGTKVITSILANLKDGHYTTFLDIGCGTGKHTLIFKDCFYTGVDNNQNYLSYASSRYPFGKFIKSDVSALPFSEGSFDCVFSVCTFHHLSDEQIKKTLSEMKRVCKSGGVVCIIDNIFPRKINPVGYILFKLDRGKFQRSFKEMNDILSDYNFEEYKCVTGTFPYEYCVFKYLKNKS